VYLLVYLAGVPADGVGVPAATVVSDQRCDPHGPDRQGRYWKLPRV